MTREQLIEELTQVRQEVSGIAHKLNNTLVGILGNISLAKMYHVRGGARDQVTIHLESADRTFLDGRPNILNNRGLHITNLQSGSLIRTFFTSPVSDDSQYTPIPNLRNHY